MFIGGVGIITASLSYKKEVEENEITKLTSSPCQDWWQGLEI